MGEIKGIYKSKDSVDDFVRILKNLKDYDILITSGGISKGKYGIVKVKKKINEHFLIE